MSLRSILSERRSDVLEIARKYGASNVRLFGSVARGTARDDSDFDFLIDFEPGRTLLDHVRLARELEELLGRRVDVVTVKALKQRYRDKVLSEAVPI